MGMSSLVGHASTDIGNPIASAICDICGFRYNHNKLNFEHEWAGNDVINLRLLACPTCLDTPNEQLRSLVLPPDPIPTKDPRLEPFAQDANAGNLSGYGYQNAANSTPYPVTNWDTPGQYWDTPGTMWDNVDQDVPAEVPD